MARTITLVYLALGAAWIFFTDRLLLWLSVPSEQVMNWQTTKGWLYVLVSSALLYLLLRRQQRHDDAGTAALLASQQEVQRMNADLERRVSERTQQLESANRELESFTYAVSHDLRAPLRSLSGFSQMLWDAAPAGLDGRSMHYLERIQEASHHMSSLIDDLLKLSRISRSELHRQSIDLSRLTADVAASIIERHPDRNVRLEVAPDMSARGDARLLRIAMENMLSNAWKYTAKIPEACITVGVQQNPQGTVFYVRDNGIGFDMAYADKLFKPFQRLHAEADFPGNGIGLVIVQRILALHGGRVWAEARPGEGATFYFTLDS